MGKPIQVRDVPEAVHAELTARAGAAGMSLSAYIRRLLVREASRPPLEDVLARAGGRATGVGLADVVAIIRDDRDRRA